MNAAQVLDGGFADTVLGAQSAFRAVMDAFANPGTVQGLPETAGPARLGAGLAAVALTLIDHDTPIWLEADLAEDRAVVDWLAFQTGAPLVTDPARAQFVFVADGSGLPRFESFAQGTSEYPDRSTTIVLAVPELTGGPELLLRGPGIKTMRSIAPQGLPVDFLAQWTANRALFPRGIDMLLVCRRELIGLPRSTRISEA